MFIWLASSNRCGAVAGRSIITKKGDGSQVKESTDSSTTLEDDDVKGNHSEFIWFWYRLTFFHILLLTSFFSSESNVPTISVNTHLNVAQGRRTVIYGLGLNHCGLFSTLVMLQTFKPPYFSKYHLNWTELCVTFTSTVSVPKFQNLQNGNRFSKVPGTKKSFVSHFRENFGNIYFSRMFLFYNIWLGQ